MKHNYKHAGARTWRCVVLSSLVVLALFGEIRLSVAAAPKSNATAPGRVGVVTILEGKAIVIHSLSQFDAAEGVRLLPGDIIRTQAKSLMRIEYPDECSLEAGPETQLQLFHPADKKRGNRPALYLMQGWLKLGCKSGTAAAFTMKDLDVVGISRVLVIRADGDSRAIFAEQGTARVIKHRSGDSGSVALNPGDFLDVEPDVTSDVQPRPTAQFMEALPRAYRDTLPSRYSVYVTRVVEPQNPRSFGYADVEPWLNAEPVVRRQFVRLWLRKVNDPAFRAPLDRDLAKHPEWDRILHPEKYEVEETVPPPPAAGNRNAAAPPGPDSRPESVPR
ncbi:MAG TPA: hypothetical protein VGI23_16600 [Steroidobacteraceae bacterium]